MQAERSTLRSVEQQLQARTEQLGELEALRAQDKQDLETALEACFLHVACDTATACLEYAGTRRRSVLHDCASKLS